MENVHPKASVRPKGGHLTSVPCSRGGEGKGGSFSGRLPAEPPRASRRRVRSMSGGRRRSARGPGSEAVRWCGVTRACGVQWSQADDVRSEDFLKEGVECRIVVAICFFFTFTVCRRLLISSSKVCVPVCRRVHVSVHDPIVSSLSFSSIFSFFRLPRASRPAACVHVPSFFVCRVPRARLPASFFPS